MTMGYKKTPPQESPMDPEEILLLCQWEKLGLLRQCNRQVRETTEKLALLSFTNAYSTTYQDQSES